MKTLFLFFTLLAISASSLVEKRQYEKLQRKFIKDIDKCEVKAKKMLSKNRKDLMPHFFLVKVNFSRYQMHNGASHQYRHLNRAMSYGLRLQKLGTNKMYQRQEWLTLKDSLQAAYLRLAKRLEAQNQTTKLNALRIKANKLDLQLYNPTRKKETKSKPIAVESTFKAGFYYGLANGAERVEPYDLSKEKHLLMMINSARRGKGLVALVWDEQLSYAARYHAYDMATQGYFHHASYDRNGDKLVKVGETFPRIRAFYTSGFVNSENIAAGSKASKDTYHQWYTSKGHNRNMFNKSSRKVGIGMYYHPDSPFKYYWVFCTALK